MRIPDSNNAVPSTNRVRTVERRYCERQNYRRLRRIWTRSNDPWSHPPRDEPRREPDRLPPPAPAHLARVPCVSDRDWSHRCLSQQPHRSRCCSSFFPAYAFGKLPGGHFLRAVRPVPMAVIQFDSPIGIIQSIGGGLKNKCILWDKPPWERTVQLVSIWACNCR